ncbi:bifunctional acetate--CoA ligase family protein/GNAT family N-acetyltransferase [Roseomonas marmotae]|uniref:GNAT family N-acetyltransferase n=1 Tax=Roseomonas marmotae TaxID=2768161 RepID=A0ABS3KAN0_9PROT|nr:GNAT family N-acetyltransferase [Roseomonas marmotae]MBO1074502.1 GNAT family N-acetyltransferase [Roseomonas marmotae]QTI78232.1 GNAT family N-acetyltransferase [Roseomonas marmotae]
MTLPIPISQPQRRFRAASLFRPRSVVLLGDAALDETAILARNLAAGGFQGQLYSVGCQQHGLVPASGIEELPEAPDLAVLCLPPAEQKAAMTALASKGCFAAIVPVASPDLAAVSAATGVHAFGAHSFGLCLPSIGLNASLSHLQPQPGRLALLCQSGAMARTIIDWAAGENLGFSHIVGIGTNQGAGFAMVLDWLARDALAGAVLLDIRRIKNRRMFISAARAAARTRAVVAIRPGGRQSDATGTSDAVMEAALRRAGVLRVSGLEDLLAAAETLARTRPARRAGPDAMAGDRIAIVSNAQGPAQLAADAVVAGGARLARWNEAADRALSLALPDASGTNPLLLPSGQSHRLAEAASMLAALQEVDAVVAIHSPSAHDDNGVAAAAMAAAAKATRGAPVLVSWLGQASAGPARHKLGQAGVAVFASPEAAVRGALHLAMDRRNRAAAAELPPSSVLRLTPDRAVVRRVLDLARAEGRLSLTEQESLSILAAYGQPVAPGETAADPAEAARVAERIGFPVVLKLSSPDLPRKTDVGGVVLNLPDARAVRQAAAGMLERVRRDFPATHVQGFLVQPMLGLGMPKAHELRLRLGDDAMFGPWIGFGRGGTTSDFEPDVAFDLPPLNRILALAMIRRTRGVRLLEGFRDLAAVDLERVVDTLVRLSQIAVDFPEIEDLIINPLMARGDEVVVLDASLRLRPGREGSFLAIPPYPAEMTHGWTTREGQKLTIRPIRPEDAAAQAEAFSQLTPEDVRWRFFTQLRALPPEQIVRMTHIDYDREMALVAVEQREDGGEHIVCTARLIREPGSDRGEFAVVTLPGWKGQGLARHLMESLFDWARGQGLHAVIGQILSDNRPMIGFARALGFSLRRSPDDEEVMEAQLLL